MKWFDIVYFVGICYINDNENKEIIMRNPMSTGWILKSRQMRQIDVCWDEGGAKPTKADKKKRKLERQRRKAGRR